jgi:hypothetical protein
MNLMVKLVALISVSVLGVTLPGAGNAGRDRLVAQSDIGGVLYRMIACDDAALSASDCHAREQQRLARRLRRQWIVAAAKIYVVKLTPDEQLVVERTIAAEEAAFAAAAKHFHALAVAALEIQRGGDRSLMLPALAKQGITAQEVDWELAHLPDVAAAERAAATDYVLQAESRRAMTTRSIS